MKSIWRIRALNNGTIEFERSIGTHLTRCGEILDVPVTVFLIESIEDSKRVVVDTGMESPERSHSVLGQRAFRSRDQELDAIFQRLHQDPGYVATVIHTHLHHDHCGNNGFFKNARFFVQREELRYAFVPLPDETKSYFSPLIGLTPSFMGTSFELVEGDDEILPGIRVMKTPGHTPGSQSVLVDTANGVYALAGDNVMFHDNVEKNIPVGHIYSRADWFSSMERIRALSDHILPSHDPALFSDDPALFPGT
jgi:N-acyl homoserine lactone hydrolase